MKRIRYLFSTLSLLFPTEVLAQNNIATTRVPMCLQFPDTQKYVPCTGVVPVDVATGNALSWDGINKGTPDKPVYTQPVVNGQPVSNINPLPVTGGGGGSGTGVDQVRRAFWNDSTDPLDPGEIFTGSSRDNGGTLGGTASRWNSFACFATADQVSTVYLQASNDNTNWFTVQSKTMSGPSASVYLSQPMFTKYWRCRVVNGSTSQTSLIVNSSFGM